MATSEALPLSCPLADRCRKQRDYIKAVQYIKQHLFRFAGVPEGSWAFAGNCPHKLSDGLGGDLIPRELMLYYQKCPIFSRWFWENAAKAQGGARRGSSRFVR